MALYCIVLGHRNQEAQDQLPFAIKITIADCRDAADGVPLRDAIGYLDQDIHDQLPSRTQAKNPNH